MHYHPDSVPDGRIGPVLTRVRAPMIVIVMSVAAVAVGIAVLSALVIAHYSFGWPWFVVRPAESPDDHNFLDALRLGLTIGAGFGGAVALVVAYRRQGIHERQEPRDRYGVAVSQLGSETPVIRLAGVYALANLADEWPAQRQQCVDVLCAYLRLPWESAPDPDHPLAARTITRTVAHEPQETRTYAYPDAHGEAEVRKTILRVIADHLRPGGAAGSRRIWRRNGWRLSRLRGGAWSHLRLDFTSATLPSASMSDCVIPPTASFRVATFTRDASFAGVTFTGDAYFDRVTFTGTASFNMGDVHQKRLLQSEERSPEPPPSAGRRSPGTLAMKFGRS
jgi:hypothetical protein